MSNHDVEDWLDERIPEQTSAALDARVMRSAELQLGRRRRGQWRRRSLGVAALVAVAVGLALLWRASPGDDTPNSRARLLVSNDSYFEVETTTRYLHEPNSEQLRLQTGEVYAISDDLALDVVLAAGRVHLDSATARIALLEGDVAMQKFRERRPQSTLKKSALVVVIAVTSGVAWLYSEADEPTAIERQDEHVAVVVANDAGDLQLVDIDSPSAVESGAAASDEPTTATPDPTIETTPPSFSAVVVDRATGSPIAGARVGWLSQWGIPAGVTYRTKVGRSVSMTSLPGQFTVGTSEYLQVPFEPSYPKSDRMKFRVESVTDENGRFELPVRSGDSDHLLVMADGYHPSFPQRGGMAIDGDSALVYELSRSRLVRGWLLDSSGESLTTISRHANLRATIAIGVGDWTATWMVPVAEDGHYEIELADVDEVTLEVAIAGYSDASQTIAVGESLVEHDILLDEHLHVRGRAVDPDGGPLAGVSVVIESKRAGWFGGDASKVTIKTGDDGLFIANVSGKSVKISAFKPGCFPLSIDALDESRFDDCELVLEPAALGAIVGRVVDDRGRGVSDASILVERVGASGAAVPRAVTDADGAFRVADLEPTTYTLSVERRIGPQPAKGDFRTPAIRGVPIDFGRVAVESGRDSDPIVIEVSRGGTIDGQCFTDDGAGAPDCIVSLYKPGLLGKNELIVVMTSDADGRFGIRDIPPGLYAVSGPGSIELVHVEVDKPVLVELGGATGSLDARFVRDGRPVAEASIALGRIGQSISDVKLGSTDADGRFQCDHLSAGRYLMRVRTQDGSVLSDQFRIAARPERRTFEWPTTRVALSFVGVPPTSAARASLTLVAISGVELGTIVPLDYRQIATVSPRDDGLGFEFAGVGAGEYELRVTDGSFERTERVVVAGIDVDLEWTRKAK